MSDGGSQRKIALYGPVIELNSTVPMLDPALSALFNEFTIPGWPEPIVSVTGTIHPYDQAEVLPHLSEGARHFAKTADGSDIYQEGERYWLVDERWGMAELDTERNEWRSWILPEPKLDATRVAELAVLWPMAQLAQSRGVHLLPAVSAVREGFAVLMICPFNVEPELRAMIAGGYKIIGQRWTALREDDDRVALLHMPGYVERSATPRLRTHAAEQETRVDLIVQHPGSRQNHAYCDAVVIVEGARQYKAHLEERDPASAAELLGRAWPMPHLSSSPGSPSLAARLPETCRCFEMELSRNSKDLLLLLNSIRYANPFAGEQTAAA